MMTCYCKKLIYFTKISRGWKKLVKYITYFQFVFKSFRTDYVTWNGPDHENRRGPNKSIAKGPNMSLRSGPSGLANGPNPALRKGPSGKSNGPSASHVVGAMSNNGSVQRPQGLPVMVSVM